MFKSIIKQFNDNTYRSLYSYKIEKLNEYVLYGTESGVSEELYCDHEIIVSVTTYGKRIIDVYLAIASIMRQTLKPNRIILWLDYSLEGIELPRTLKLLMKKGLEIYYCEDIKSYKKLIPALRKFPNDAIITIDDDIIYDFDCVERLVNSYLKEPFLIHSSRQHKIRCKGNKVLPYNEWEWVSSDTNVDVRNFPTGGAGTLYPPHSLDSDVFDSSVFMKICPTADDIWFKAMALKKGTLSRKIISHTPNSEDYYYILSNQDEALMKTNVIDNRNDIQFDAVFQKYNLYTLLFK